MIAIVKTCPRCGAAQFNETTFACGTEDLGGGMLIRGLNCGRTPSKPVAETVRIAKPYERYQHYRRVPKRLRDIDTPTFYEL